MRMRVILLPLTVRALVFCCCPQAVANLSRELDRFGAKLGKIRAVGILLAEGTNRLIGPEVQPHSTARTPPWVCR